MDVCSEQGACGRFISICSCSFRPPPAQRAPGPLGLIQRRDEGRGERRDYLAMRQPHTPWSRWATQGTPVSGGGAAVGCSMLYHCAPPSCCPLDPEGCTSPLAGSRLLSQVHLQAPSAEDSSTHQEAFRTDVDLPLDCSHAAHTWGDTQAPPTQQCLEGRPIPTKVSLPRDFMDKNQTPGHSSLQLLG